MHMALAQEAEIRKALAARLPPSVVVDEVTLSPIPGLYEVRSGMSVFYTDQRGNAPSASSSKACCRSATTSPSTRS